jgi:hypothetical protein
MLVVQPWQLYVEYTDATFTTRKVRRVSGHRKEACGNLRLLDICMLPPYTRCAARTHEHCWLCNAMLLALLEHVRSVPIIRGTFCNTVLHATIQ